MVLTALLLAAAPALAARPHEFSTTFGEPCIAEPCTGAELKSPDGVAVNEATGDVYVVDKGEGAVGGRVVRFNSEGVVEGEFNGSGTTAKSFESPEGIAVDNSCALQKLSGAECAAADPSNGDVYVVDAGAENLKEHRVVDKFTAEGAFRGTITEAGPLKLNEEGLEGVAVDPLGGVWVYRERPEIDGYSNGNTNEFLTAIQPNALGLPGRPGFAVDSKGDFYGDLAGETETIHRTVKWDHAGNLLNEDLGGEGSSAVAVDQVSDAAFVDKGTSVEAFSPAGTLVETLGEEHGEKHLTQGTGIGVDAATGFLYVADAGTGKVVVLGPSLPSVPKVEGESFANVGSDSASLAAEINPRSEADSKEAPTEYHFQYGRCATTDPASCKESGYEAIAPEPDGELAPDFEAHTVAVRVEGLQPGTTYHFRALARNSHNQRGQYEPGEEQTFTTEGLGGELTLPDHRGYEMVSPPDKLGALIEPISETGVVQAAASGGGITYLTTNPIEPEPRGYSNLVQVFSRRGSASWSSRDITIPRTTPTGNSEAAGPEYKFFDSELTDSVVQPLGEFNAQLSGEASEPTAFLHDLDGSCGSSCFRPLVTGKPRFANVPEGTVFGEQELCKPTGSGSAHEVCGPRFEGASADLSHVVLKSLVPLFPGTVEGELYEWSGGALAPVSILPGPGGEGTEATLGQEKDQVRGAVSKDGARIAWTAKENLYERDMTRGESVQLDSAEEVGGKPCNKCESGGGKLQFASADGTRIYFTDERRLTSDSGGNPGTEHHADLYECLIVIKASVLSCQLEDLTPMHGTEAAEVQGGVLGASENGEYVYFVANGIESETPNPRGQKAQRGQPNLYLRRGALTSFIATLSAGDEHDWDVNEHQEAALAKQPTRVSGNGLFLELMSEAPLTGYDNSDRATGKSAAEVYLYDAASGRLSCASCQPTGARPVGVEYAKLDPTNGGLVGGGKGIWTPTGLVAANVPGWTQRAVLTTLSQPRYLNDEGRLFFNSADALVPQDSNGTQDVYEYEPPGIGDCSEASATFSARSGGCVSLISSGSSAQESAFMDASETGDDVFFLTSSKLSPLDVDTSRDIYDAHVCTTASPCITYPDVQSPPCTTEASCKPSPTPQPAIFGAPASATFEGLGNPAPAPPKVVVKSLTRSQKLAAALKACKRDRAKSKRAKCQKSAHSRFGPLKRAKQKGRR